MNPMEVISQCMEEAQVQLNKITCYGEKLKLDLAYRRYDYINGEFIEEVEGDRGEIHRHTVGDSREKFIEHLLYSTIRRFAFSYECKHRRPFEDNRRQVNEIMEKCYGCLDNKYEYSLMIKLKDNIHIYFDLLDYYAQVSKECLEKCLVSGEVKRRLTFIATRQYAGKSGGMYDVAFSFEWVRYQISKIISARPYLKEKFYRYENQYERLCGLEKEEPHDPDKFYRLGMWDYATFEKAESILGGSSIKDAKAQKCAVYMLILRIHTKRNIEKDVDMLVQLSKTVDLTPFRNQLEELFVNLEKFSAHFHF